MKEFIEKLIGRLEEERDSTYFVETANPQNQHWHGVRERDLFDEIIAIVKELAEEHSHCTLCYLQSPCEYQNENAQMPMEFWERGWIPVSERLPEEKGDYLVTCNDGKVRVWWFVVEEDFRQWLSGVHQLKPIAWQPLPVPYQPKGE